MTRQCKNFDQLLTSLSKFDEAILLTSIDKFRDECKDSNVSYSVIMKWNHYFSDYYDSKGLSATVKEIRSIIEKVVLYGTDFESITGTEDKWP